MDKATQDQHAIVLLVKQIMDQIDEIASLKKQGMKAGISTELLSEMCSILPELTDLQRNYFHEVLIKLTQHTDYSTNMRFGIDYAQHSVPSKRRFINKIRTELKLAVNS